MLTSNKTPKRFPVIKKTIKSFMSTLNESIVNKQKSKNINMFILRLE